MNYKFTRKIYELCDYGNTMELWDLESVMLHAESIAKQHNAIAQKEVFVTLKKVNVKAFIKLKKYLEGFQLFRVDKNGQIKPQEELTVNKKLNYTEYCGWTKEECLYLCWVLKAAKLYEGDCLTMYAELLEVIGEEYRPLEFSNIEDVILSLVLQTDQSFEEYYDLLNDWMKEEKDEEGTLQLPYAASIPQLTFKQWKQIVDAGMEVVDNIQATRVSMATLESEFNAILRSGIFPEKKTVHEIFSEGFCKKIVNTNARRKFYFFRILLRIIEKQMEDMIQAMEEYREANGKMGTKRIEELVSHCWFEKVKNTGNHSDIPWSKIAEGANKVDLTLEQIREDLWNSRIRPSSIARAFNEAFSLYGYAFEKPVNDDNKEASRNVAPRIQKLLMEPKQTISRELLLLSVLLARANGIDDQMNLTYVKEHILYNSRYPKELDVKGNEIDGYFVYMMNQFDEISRIEDRVDLLKKVSENLMWEISENVFHDILYNKGGSKE